MRGLDSPNGAPLPHGGPRGYWQDWSHVSWRGSFAALRADPEAQARLSERRAEQARARADERELRRLRAENYTAAQQKRTPVTENRPTCCIESLGNIASNALQAFSAAPDGQCQAFSPFRLQAEMRAAGLLHERSRRCRMRRLTDRVQVTIDDRGTPSITGCETCGSVHACPCCAVRIMHERAEQLTYATNWWRQEKHGKVYLLTLTVRHQWGTALEPLFSGVADAYRALCSGAFKEWRNVVAHSVRAIEVTHGANGWHPHLHVLLFVNDEIDSSFIEQLQARWQSCVAARLGESAIPERNIGCDIRDGSAASEYLQKMGLEVASLVTKSAKGPNRSPWQLVADALHGDALARSAWAEYVAATYGKKQLTWSRKLRSECTQLQQWDEYLARMNGGDDATRTAIVFVADIDGKTWESLVKRLAWVRAFTDAARRCDVDAVHVLLTTVATYDHGRHVWIVRGPP